MSELTVHREIDLDPTRWHLHLRYRSAADSGLHDAEMLEPHHNEARADLAYQMYRAARGPEGLSFSYAELLKPGDAPLLPAHQWYVHLQYAATDRQDGTVPCQTLRPCKDRDHGYEIFVRWRDAIRSSTPPGRIHYAAIVPPHGHPLLAPIVGQRRRS